MITQLKHVMDNNRVGILALWGNDGRIDHQDSLRCIELLGKEVLPALRDYAKQLDLKDPFEKNAPVSVEQPATAAAAGS